MLIPAFVCGLECAFLSNQNYAQIIVLICKAPFMIGDHIVHTCDLSDTIFTPPTMNHSSLTLAFSYLEHNVAMLGLLQ